MRKNKKGEISLQMIILAILGLVALIILIFVFKDQIGRVSKTYFGITEQVEAESKGEVCESLFGGKKCMAACDETYKHNLGTDFSDCKAMQGKPICCASDAGL